MSFPYKDQPVYVHLSVRLGDVEMDIPPDNLQDFSFDRVATGASSFSGSRFTLTVYDDTAFRLEEVLLTGKQEIEFDYGYSGVPGTSVAGGIEVGSKRVRCMVSEYTMSFEGGGVTLELTGLSTSLVQDKGNVGSAVYSEEVYYGVPSKIVAALAAENGWAVSRIVDTKVVLDHRGMPKKFERVSKTPVQFITSQLLEGVEPVTVTGISSGYTFYFDDNDAVVYEPLMEVDPRDVEAKVTNRYEYYSGRVDNGVISFSPEFKGIVGLAAGGGQVESYSVDTLRNEMVGLSLGGDSYRDVYAQPGNFVRVTGMSSASYTDLEKKASSLWSGYAKNYYSATMDIVGDATLKVGSYISVLVLTKYGLPHHTSGIYYVSRATDSISGGTFTTSLSLWKFGMSTSSLDTQQGAISMLEMTGGILETIPSWAQPYVGPDGYVSSNLPATPQGAATVNNVVGSRSYAGAARDIISVALAEVGAHEPKGDDKYIRDYNTWTGWKLGLDTTDWCAIFVSWCARMAGVDESVIPTTIWVKTFWETFVKNGRYGLKGSYIPKRGDLFIQMANGASHVGLVQYSDGVHYWSVEGNARQGSTDYVREIKRLLTEKYLTGFCIPQYPTIIKA